MRRERLVVGAVWLVLTGLGEVLVWNAPILPGAYAKEADVSDSAFLLLMRLAVPVFAFVLAMLIVSIARFRTREAPAEDGPPLAGNRVVYAAWLAVTSALAVVLIVNPGLVGLAEIRGEPRADMVVRVEAAQWFWTISYPSGFSTTDELVLPADERIRFEVTSKDVIHSFWIPAFRVKIDAVPGRTTVVYATPTRTGSFDDDFNLRLQCAELCGIGHALMAIPVRVLDEAGFDTWLQEQAQGSATECSPAGTELQIAAANIAFDTRCLAAPSGQPFTIAFENRDAGIPHNVAIARDEEFQDPVFVGEIFSGPDIRIYDVGALPAGTYFFRCDVHAIQMSGTFVVA